MSIKQKRILSFCRKLDAALIRKSACSKQDYLYNVKCEVCGQNIRRYVGTVEGIICSTCVDPVGAGGVVKEPMPYGYNITPLKC